MFKIFIINKTHLGCGYHLKIFNFSYHFSIFSSINTTKMWLTNIVSKNATKNWIECSGIKKKSNGIFLLAKKTHSFVEE